MLYKLIQNRLVRYSFDFVVFTSAVVLPFSVQAGVFQSIIGNNANAQESASEIIHSDSIIDAHVLASAQNPNPNNTQTINELLVQEGALVSSGPINRDNTKVNQNSDAISTYIVREGDSLSEIAGMFGVTANTILWANDISKASSIKPGDTLIILPIAGTRHVVKAGDTIASIAKKYKGSVDEIISFNQLSSATDIAGGDTLMIPGGEMSEMAPKAQLSTKPASAKPKPGTANVPTNTYGALVTPMPGSVKTQGIHGHNGIDFGAPVGTPVRASAGGTVIIAKGDGGWGGGYGNYVVIKHNNGVQTLYAHLAQVNVSAGETVVSGENIGKSGNTGKSTGPHLHFEVRGAKNPF